MAEKRIDIVGNSDSYKKAMRDAQQGQKELTNAFIEGSRSRISVLTQELELLKEYSNVLAGIANTERGRVGGGVPSAPVSPIPPPAPASPIIPPVPKKPKKKRWEQSKEIGFNKTLDTMASGLKSGAAGEALVSAIGGTTSQLLAFIPKVGGFLGGLTNTLTGVATAAMAEASKRDRELLLTKNLTGDTATGIGALSMTADVEAQYMRSISQSRGVSGINYKYDKNGKRSLINNEIKDQLILEKKTGQEFGAFNSLNQFERMYGTKGESTERLMTKFLESAANSGLWNIDKKDFSQLGEKIQTQAQLMERESQIGETVSGDKSMAIQMAFGTMGKGWGDSRASGRIKSIDEAIRNPSNKFMDNVIKSAIIQENPNVTLSGLQDIQEQGILNPKIFGRVLQNISGLSNEEQHLFLQKFSPSLKGNREARETLLQNRELFTGDLSVEEIKKRYKEKHAGTEIDDKTINDITTGMTTTSAESVQKAMTDALAEIGKILNTKIYPAIMEIFNFLSLGKEKYKELKQKWEDMPEWQKSFSKTLVNPLYAPIAIWNTAKSAIKGSDKYGENKELYEASETFDNFISNEKTARNKGSQEDVNEIVKSERGLGGTTKKEAEIISTFYKTSLKNNEISKENVEAVNKLIIAIDGYMQAEKDKTNRPAIVSNSKTNTPISTKDKPN
jgi:predicted lactoylglutathione lyase